VVVVFYIFNQVTKHHFSHGFPRLQRGIKIYVYRVLKQKLWSQYFFIFNQVTKHHFSLGFPRLWLGIKIVF